MKKTIDVAKIHEEIERFIGERDWDQFHSMKNLSMALSVESSELVEIFQWMKEEDSNRIGNDPELKARLQDELADIFYYLLRMSGKAGIDLEEAILGKIRKNAEKYPVEKSKGNSKKYNEF